MPDANNVREWLRARCDEALLAADAAPEADRAYWSARQSEAHDALRDFSERWPDVHEMSQVDWLEFIDRYAAVRREPEEYVVGFIPFDGSEFIPYDGPQGDPEALAAFWKKVQDISDSLDGDDDAA